MSLTTKALLGLVAAMVTVIPGGRYSAYLALGAVIALGVLFSLVAQSNQLRRKRLAESMVPAKAYGLGLPEKLIAERHPSPQESSSKRGNVRIYMEAKRRKPEMIAICVD